MHGVQTVAQLVIMAREQVPVAIQGERHRGVPGPHADLLGIGSGGAVVELPTGWLEEAAADFAGFGSAP